jgi:hypothetical protein
MPQSITTDDGEKLETTYRPAVGATTDYAVMLLEDMGHTLFEASSGEQALRLFRDHPEIDLISAVRTERPGTPAIIATGYGELATQLGKPIVRLGKPFDEADLARSVLEVMTMAQ